MTTTNILPRELSMNDIRAELQAAMISSSQQRHSRNASKASISISSISVNGSASASSASSSASSLSTSNSPSHARNNSQNTFNTPPKRRKGQSVHKKVLNSITKRLRSVQKLMSKKQDGS